MAKWTQFPCLIVFGYISWQDYDLGIWDVHHQQLESLV